MGHLQNSDFEKLALPLLDPLYNFARWLSGDPDEALDLVQETFVKALKGLGTFKEGTNFRAWMFRILRNTFLTSRSGLDRRSTEQADEEGLRESAATSEARVSLMKMLKPGVSSTLILIFFHSTKASAVDIVILR